MTRLAAFLALLASPALSETFPARIDRMGGGGDEVRIEAEGEHAARLTYGNDGGMLSMAGVYTVQVGGIVVDVQIIISGGPERIIVRPRGDYIAVPPEAAVDDGMEQEIWITLPMG